MDLAKITLRAETLRKLSPERRSALLMLGLLLNEANWLRKLLVRSADAVTTTPDGQASLSLTLMMATIAAAKAHEGWRRLTGKEMGPTLAELQSDPETSEARMRAKTLLRDKGIADIIRNGMAFHYPKSLDVSRLDRLSEAETYVLSPHEGIGGNMLSHLSTMAVMDEFIGLSDGNTWQERMSSTFRKITAAVEAYGDYVTLLHIGAIRTWFPKACRPVEQVRISDAPYLTPAPMVYFAHPQT